VFGFVAQSLLEGLVNISLNVVLVEFALVFFIVAHVGTHVLIKALLLRLNIVADAVVVALLFVVVLFDFREFITQSAQALDFWGQLLFLLLHFAVNSLNKSRQVLHGLRLGVIELLLQF
jgi:hypothetical protein